MASEQSDAYYEGRVVYELPGDFKQPEVYCSPALDTEVPNRATDSSINDMSKSSFQIIVTGQDVSSRANAPGSLAAPPPPYTLGATAQEAPFSSDVKYNYQSSVEQQSPSAQGFEQSYPGLYRPFPEPHHQAVYSPLPGSHRQTNPQRPQLPHAQFTAPYVAPPHDPSQQQPAFQTPQFEHPFTQDVQSRHASLGPPPLPARPTSAPPGRYSQWQPQTAGQPAMATSPMVSPTAFVPPTGPVPASDEYVDDRTSGGVSRFVGNMLVVRLARSGVQSVASTAKLPYYLSPWGDNNPITLPHVRKRDIALAGFMHLGIDALAPSAITLVESGVQYAATFTAEQTVDQGIHKLKGAKAHKVIHRVGVSSLEMRIKHKLIGEDAIISLFSEREAGDRVSCSKGWFCPYLYASGRTPQLVRSKDFAIAQLVGPGLAADAALAPTLLNSITHPPTGSETGPYTAMAATTTTTIHTASCPSGSPHPTFPRFRRLGLFVVGLTPYRTATAWSQSRIPNEARLQFHLFSHVPVLVLPVRRDCAVLGWSPWTLGQMVRNAHDGVLQGSSGGYTLERQYYEILSWLESVVDVELMEDRGMREGGWKGIVGTAVGEMITAVRSMPRGFWEGPNIKGVVDLERAGIIGLRF